MNWSGTGSSTDEARASSASLRRAEFLSVASRGYSTRSNLQVSLRRRCNRKESTLNHLGGEIGGNYGYDQENLMSSGFLCCIGCRRGLCSGIGGELRCRDSPSACHDADCCRRI